LALRRHWRQHPRPEWLIAAYLKFKPIPETSEARPVRAAQPSPQQGRMRAVPPPTGQLQQLFASLGGKPGKTVVMPL
jgi:hypothetical protein